MPVYLLSWYFGQITDIRSANTYDFIRPNIGQMSFTLHGVNVKIVYFHKINALLTNVETNTPIQLLHIRPDRQMSAFPSIRPSISVLLYVSQSIFFLT